MKLQAAFRQGLLALVLFGVAIAAAGPQLFARGADPGTGFAAHKTAAGAWTRGVFILALDQRDYARSAVHWWSGWDQKPVALLEAGANPQLAVNFATGRLYVADTHGDGTDTTDRLRVYDLVPSAEAGPTSGQAAEPAPPFVARLRQEVAVTDRARYKEPIVTPYLALTEGKGPVFLVGSTAPSNDAYTSWVTEHDPKSLQAGAQILRFPGLVAPRLVVPAVSEEIKLVLWSGNRFLAVGQKPGVTREWAPQGTGGQLQAPRITAAVVSADGKRVYAFRARGAEWSAWDKGWQVSSDLELPAGWQVTAGAAVASPTGDRIYVGVAPREQASRGTLREVWIMDAGDGGILDKVKLSEPADGLAITRDGLHLILWRRSADEVIGLELPGSKPPRRVRLEGWAPVWIVP